jgi:hypothetical protein
MKSKRKEPDNQEKLAALFCDTNRQMFEEGVIGLAMVDPKFAERVLPILCVSRERGGPETEDFSALARMAAWRITRRHLMTDPDRENPAMVGTFDTFFADEVRHARVSEEYRQVVWDAIANGIASVANIRAVIEIGFPYWLRKTRVEAENKFQEGVLGWDPQALVRTLSHAGQQLDDAYEQRKTGLKYTAAERPERNMKDMLLTEWGGLNEKLGGGMSLGECFLVVGGSGAGKTVFSTQVFSHWGLCEKKGVYLTTEQKPWELRLRNYAQRMSLPFTLVKEPHALASLPAPKKKQKLEIEEKFDRNLFWKDWSDGRGASVVADLEHVLEEAHDELGDLHFFIIDWIGGALPETTEADMVRHLFMGSANHSIKMAKKHNLVGIVLAQADPTKGYNNPRVQPEHVSECKGMHKNMTGFVGISGLRPTDAGDDKGFKREQTFNVGKSRMGEGGLVNVVREFEYQRFVTR